MANFKPIKACKRGTMKVQTTPALTLCIVTEEGQPGSFAFTTYEARGLRDWLNKALATKKRRPSSGRDSA